MKMGVRRYDMNSRRGLAMVDADNVTAKVFVTDEFDRAFSDGSDRGPDRCGEIDS